MTPLKTRHAPRRFRSRPLATAVLGACIAGTPIQGMAQVLIIDDDDDQQATAPARSGAPPAPSASATGLSLDASSLWLEYGRFLDDASPSDRIGHLRGEIAALWSPAPRWEVRLAARTYGYLEVNRNAVEDLSLDYGESYVRYKGDNNRITVGAQEVIWGRIDEFPPSDRLSTQDISRYLVDELEYRRRASGAIRWEFFWENHKLDVLAIPRFRAAELPDRDSLWFPVNQRSGEVFALESTPATQALVRDARIDLDEPDSDGGYGIRYSRTGAGIDYAVNVQKGRLSIPYFTFDPSTSTIGTLYPDTWSAGMDLSFEALGAVVRMEAQWTEHTPVTGLDGRVMLVESVAWGASLELFPGDGDARLNLQLLGNWLDTEVDVLDRDNLVAIGGAYELPFANEQWRFRTRFFAGIDARDWYINPEIAYTGIPGQELYMKLHYFDGEDGTPGGFHENHSFVALGWRLSF